MLKIVIRWLGTLQAKIVLVITMVAVGVLAVAAVESYYAHIPASRGRFMRKHYNRFDEYRRGLGRALAANASFVAQAPTLVDELSGNDQEDVEQAMQTVADGQANAARSIGEAVADSQGQTPGTSAYDRFVASVRRTLDPDLVFAFDRRGDVLGEADLHGTDLAQSRLFTDVVGGMTVVSELWLVGPHVYQVSAAPVRDSDADVVGGVVLGQRIERYMQDYQGQSDANVSKQHRPVLVTTDGRIAATVFPADTTEAFTPALDPENYRQEPEGPDDTVPVIVVPGLGEDGGEAMYDFWSEEVRGYSGGEYGTLGTMFLLRTRNFKANQLEERIGETQALFLIVLVIAIFIGVGLSWLITRRINRYVAATDDLAQGQGDLTRRLESGGRDELGRLAKNLNAVFGYIHDLAANVQSSAFQVGASSAEISAASKQMLEGAQEQARKTESSSAAVTELSASIQQVAENAMEATRVARSSGEAVQDAIGRMNEIRTTVEEAAARIQELGESGKRIGNIVEVIRQISDQTTLLALNAAIEAAHAGEQGRGFAVVADEVSGLAKRVGQSARDIEDLIATIKEQTAEAVSAMELGTSEVEAGTGLVTNTLTDLQTLVGVVEDTAAAVQEQAVASDEIARNMDVVQRIAQDVLGASEEAVSQGEHLHRLAFNLEESVKGFKIRAVDGGETTHALPAETEQAG
jgi:methyl-accepting chemotaxis protein